MNPFDAEDGSFRVLVNDLGQYSLWPASVPTPEGWRESVGPADRATCLHHVTTHWKV